MAGSGGSVSSSALWDALLAFRESPGRHAVAHGEPRLAFDHPLDVLLLAADRPVTSSLGEVPSNDVRQAARFFVRVIMLRPGGTHYDVLGVRPGGDLAAVRDHYRLLIRLTHPDFARDDVQWPEDAAARVNMAHDVLSSPVKRAEYDAQFKPQAAPDLSGRPVGSVKVRKTTAGLAPRSRRRVLAFASGALIVVAVGLLASLWSSADGTSDASLGQATAPERLLNLAEASDAVQSGSGGGWAPDQAFAAGSTAVQAKVAAPKPVVPVARPLREPPAPSASTAVTVMEPPSSILPLKIDRAISAPSPGPKVLAASPVTEPVPIAAEPVVARSAADEGAGPRPEVAPPKADIRVYQPVLADLLHLLETGQTERLQRWVARSTQQEVPAERFAGAYQRLVGDAAVTGLGSARFDLKQVQDRQVVHGVIQIKLLDRNQQPQVKDLRLQAHFVSRSGGGPQLANLEVE